MVKTRSVKGKKEKSVRKLTHSMIIKPSGEGAGEGPSKELMKREEGQLVWFFVIIAVVFLAFIIPYLYIQSQKSFEYSGVRWVIEENSGLKIYYARFPALDESNITYNAYLREDPRENNVTTNGTFVDFKVGAYISLSPDIDSCRGNVARVMIDLGSFLRFGVGVGNLTVASSDYAHSRETKRPYINCDSKNVKQTIVSINIGEPRVIQSNKNPYCYEIYVEDCNDISPVEKFITKTIGDIMDEKARNELGVRKPLNIEGVEEKNF